MPNDSQQRAAAIELHRTEKSPHSRSTPPPIDKINRTERLLRDAMRRSGLQPSLCRQCARMVGHFAQMRLRGYNVVYPGMKKMAQWGEVSERMARKNFRQLEYGDVITVIGFENGGRRHATEWIVDATALRKWLIMVGANPSPKLLEMLDTILMGRASNVGGGGNGD